MDTGTLFGASLNNLRALGRRLRVRPWIMPVYRDAVLGASVSIACAEGRRFYSLSLEIVRV
jgi:hypothetical protein